MDEKQFQRVEREEEARSLNKLMRRLVVVMAVLLVSMISAIVFLKLKERNQPLSRGRAGNRELKAFIGKKCDRE